MKRYIIVTVALASLHSMQLMYMHVLWMNIILAIHLEKES